MIQLFLAQAQPAADAAEKLLERGVLGALVVLLLAAVCVLAVYVSRVHRDMLGLQNNRVTDAQKVTEAYGEVIKSCTATMTNMSNVLEGRVEADRRLEAGFRDLAEECRGSRSGRK